MSKVVVFGANGMAGHVVSSYLKMAGHDVTRIARENADVCLDIKSKSLLDSYFLGYSGLGGAYIINCIGLLVKECESTPSDAVYINSWFPHYLAGMSKRIGAKLIHISTDCVFNGSKGSYKENDIKDGIGMYAQSKSLGEVVNDHDLTIRTSIVGPELKNGTGLFHWFMSQQGQVNGYTNAFWGGVTTLELAKYIEWVIHTPLTGLCHLTNGERVSKFYMLDCFNFYTGRRSIVTPTKAATEIDKSIVNTRGDNTFKVQSYDYMFEQMVDYIRQNKELYSRYLS